MGLVPKRKTERAPAVDKLLKPAVGVALAMLAYFVIQGFQAEVSSIPYFIILLFMNNLWYSHIIASL